MRNRRRTVATLGLVPVVALLSTLAMPLLAAGPAGNPPRPGTGCGPASASTTILGPSSMSVADLMAWWASTGRSQPPSLATGVDDVIALYVTVGDAEGVRGDMALAQAVLETGHFTSSDTALNNFAGIGHADGRPAGLFFPDASTGVRAHIQLLKKYAAGNDTPLAGPDVAPDARASASTWEQLATRWASAPDYGARLPNVYETMAAAADSLPSDALSRLSCAPAMSAPEIPTDGAGVPLTTVRGITVHAALAGQMDALLAAAEADGLHLTGWGYRSHQRQIALRRENCGTTHYAVYEMPSSHCTPPTARPGTSQHEQGLAIDFDNCSTRRSACYVWLADRAHEYGLYNLPSEPWHWSNDGT